jgi:hypothetical protein
MKRNLRGMLVSGAVIAGMSLIVFPVAAETPLSKETGRKWGEKCMPTGNAIQCCNAQRNGETARRRWMREQGMFDSARLVFLTRPPPTPPWCGFEAAARVAFG